MSERGSSSRNKTRKGSGSFPTKIKKNIVKCRNHLVVVCGTFNILSENDERIDKHKLFELNLISFCLCIYTYNKEESACVFDTLMKVLHHFLLY